MILNNNNNNNNINWDHYLTCRLPPQVKRGKSRTMFNWNLSRSRVKKHQGESPISNENTFPPALLS